MIVAQKVRHEKSRIFSILCALTAGGVFAASGIFAQTLPSDSFTPTTLPSQELISLDFPANLELKVLIQYVGQRLGINFIYDDQTVNQRITIISPTKVTRDSLLGLLQSTLKMKGLIVVDGDQPGWKKILPMTSVNSVAFWTGVGWVSAHL